MTNLEIYEDGLNYLAVIGGRWYRWPAEESGWVKAQPCEAPDAADVRSLDEWHADLACRLSGVMVTSREVP